MELIRLNRSHKNDFKKINDITEKELENPEFLKKIKAENQFLKTDEMADKIGFSKFLEEQQQSNYERTAE